MRGGSSHEEAPVQSRARGDCQSAHVRDSFCPDHQKQTQGQGSQERQTYQPSDKPKNTASRKKFDRTADSHPKKDTAKTAKPDREQQVKPTKTPDEIAEAREKAQQVRREYDRIKNKSPERREYQRQLAQEQRQRAKELGK